MHCYIELYVWEPVFHNLLQSLNVIARQPWNCIKAFCTVWWLKHTASNCHIVWILQFMSILVFKLLISICPKLQFSSYYFLDKYLKIICKHIFRFIPFLCPTIEITYQLTDGFCRLKNIFKCWMRPSKICWTSVNIPI